MEYFCGSTINKEVRGLKAHKQIGKQQNSLPVAPSHILNILLS
jgi:hypothetical protein